MSTTPEVASWIEEAARHEMNIDGVAVPSYKFYVGGEGEPTVLHFDEEDHVYYTIGEDGQRVNVPGVTTILGKAIDKSFALVPWATKLAVTHIREQMMNVDGSFKQLSTEEFNILLDQAKNKHKEKLESAGDIGRIAHDFLERIAKKAIAQTDGYVLSANPLPEMPIGYVQGSNVTLELQTSMARQCVLAGLDWIRRHKVQFLHAERKVYSRSHNFAGTVDGVVYMDSCDDLACCRGASFKRTCGILDYKSSNEIRSSYAWQLVAYQFALIEELDLPITHRVVLRLGKEDGKFEPWLISPLFFSDDLNTFLDALSLYKSLEHIEGRRSADKRELRAAIKGQKDTAKALLAEQARIAKQEAKDAARAEKDAKAAILAESRAEAKLAKQSQARPILVSTPISPNPSWVERQFKAEPSPVVEAMFKAEPERREALAELSAYDQEIGIDAQPSKPAFDEDFWAGGFSVGADGKVADIKAAASSVRSTHESAKPGIAHTMHGNAEPRATRFWTTSTTYTIQGRY
jgi:hypothetical protein